MRLVYYTRPCFLDTALPRVKELSKLVELHLLLEIAPEGWRSSLFELEPRRLKSGIQPARELFHNGFPPSLESYWRDTASFNVVVYECPRSVHPATWWTSRKAARFIRDLEPDIIHLDDLSLRLAWAIHELRDVNIVLSLHDVQAHSGEQNWRTALARRLTFNRVNQFILHNNAAKHTFCSKYNVAAECVSVVPLGVLDIFREWVDAPIIESDQKIVLFFGRLSPYKGLDVLLKAAPLVAEKVPGVRFVIAGSPIVGYKIPPIPELPNGSTVEVISEYISNEKLAKLFQQTSVLACPYIDATQSGVILTAYAFGKPVVATNVGGLPEYVIDNETGFLIPPDDPEALSIALVRILNDSSLKKQLESGIMKAKNKELNWGNIAEQTVELYGDVLAGSSTKGKLPIN